MTEKLMAIASVADKIAHICEELSDNGHVHQQMIADGSRMYDLFSGCSSTHMTIACLYSMRENPPAHGENESKKYIQAVCDIAIEIAMIVSSVNNANTNSTDN